MKIAVGVEYDGSGFCGWQWQPGVRTVQQVVMQALGRIADHPVQIGCAGRTDTGVHATGQVIHFQTHARRDLRAWVLGANANLPADVSIQWVRPVSDDFHARFSALARRYRYIILNRTVRPALLRRRAAWYPQPLEVERMAQAGQALLGEHDFSSFRSAACQARHPVRIIYALKVTQVGEAIHIDMEANGFLHHMVRNIAGVLLAIGSGDRPVSWVERLLVLRDRTRGGITAPSQGLYLVGVRYPEQFALPESGAWPVVC